MTAPARMLALDDDALAWRKLVCQQAWNTYDATGGNTHPKGTAVHERMASPKPGDYVLEHSVAIRVAAGLPDRAPWPRGAGVLLRVVQEPMCPPDEWDAEAEGRPVPTEDVWYVQYGPVAEADNPANPDVCRWTDCGFMAVQL